MSKSIVVADDDPDILSIVAMSLETQGYDVYKAANGREAVDLARDHHQEDHDDHAGGLDLDAHAGPALVRVARGSLLRASGGLGSQAVVAAGFPFRYRQFVGEDESITAAPGRSLRPGRRPRVTQR